MAIGEDDLEALVSRQEQSGSEMAARIVAGWNLVDKDGKEIECTFENRLAVFANEQFASVAVAAMAEFGKVAEALGKSKTP